MDQGRCIPAMLNIIGAALIFISCVAIGMIQARKLEKRRLFLRGMHQGILALMREIDYTASPMTQAMANAALMAGPAGYLFDSAAACLRSGEGCTAGEAWLQAVDSSADIEDEDRALLSLAGEGLGISNSDNQLKALELLRIRLEKAEEHAAEQSKRLGKIWKAMGWSTAAVLVLLLI